MNQNSSNGSLFPTPEQPNPQQIPPAYTSPPQSLPPQQPQPYIPQQPYTQQPQQPCIQQPQQPQAPPQQQSFTQQQQQPNVNQSQQPTEYSTEDEFRGRKSFGEAFNNFLQSNFIKGFILAPWYLISNFFIVISRDVTVKQVYKYGVIHCFIGLFLSLWNGNPATSFCMALGYVLFLCLYFYVVPSEEHIEALKATHTSLKALRANNIMRILREKMPLIFSKRERYEDYYEEDDDADIDDGVNDSVYVDKNMDKSEDKYFSNTSTNRTSPVLSKPHIPVNSQSTNKDELQSFKTPPKMPRPQIPKIPSVGIPPANPNNLKKD